MKRIQCLAFSIACGLILSSCSPKVDNGGYVNDNSVKDELIIGQTTRDQAKEKLGSPSAQSTFGDETWYYITNRKEGWGFFKPAIVQQDVTSIAFDNAGVVTKVDHYTLKDGEDISLVSRTTPTEGHTLGFFEQLLGNIGRFNHPTDSSGPPKPGG